VYGVAVAGILAVAGGAIASEFSNDPALLSIATTYLWIVPISYGFMGMVNISSGCLNSLAKPMPAMAIGLSKSVFVQLPCAYAGAALWGINGVFAGMAASTVLVAGLAYVLAKRASAQDIAPTKPQLRPITSP
ncbi:MAG: hypothetical protein FJX59_13955, partial [Alphaproteobacteria bacterium]|nr:hypothetical protein [Alphaproteobacteria bacterium]